MKLSPSDLNKIIDGVMAAMRKEARDIINEEFANKIAKRAVQYAWGEQAAAELERRLTQIIRPAAERAIRGLTFNVEVTRE